MRESSEEIELGLDPAQDLLVRYEELDVTSCPQVSQSGTTEMSDQADVGHECARDHDENQRCCPDGNFVWSDTMTRLETGNGQKNRNVPEIWVRLLRLHGFGGKQEEHPYTTASQLYATIHNSVMLALRPLLWCCSSKQTFPTRCKCLQELFQMLSFVNVRL